MYFAVTPHAYSVAAPEFFLGGGRAAWWGQNVFLRGGKMFSKFQQGGVGGGKPLMGGMPSFHYFSYLLYFFLLPWKKTFVLQFCALSSRHINKNTLFYSFLCTYTFSFRRPRFGKIKNYSHKIYTYCFYSIHKCIMIPIFTQIKLIEHKIYLIKL